MCLWVFPFSPLPVGGVCFWYDPKMGLHPCAYLVPVLCLSCASPLCPSGQKLGGVGQKPNFSEACHSGTKPSGITSKLFPTAKSANKMFAEGRPRKLTFSVTRAGHRSPFPSQSAGQRGGLSQDPPMYKGRPSARYPC